MKQEEEKEPAADNPSEPSPVKKEVESASPPVAIQAPAPPQIDDQMKTISTYNGAKTDKYAWS